MTLHSRQLSHLTFKRSCLRRFVELAFGPFEAYSVREIGEKIFVDPVSYLRFELWIDVLESIPPAELAAILRRVQPLVEQALEEVGEPVDMASINVYFHL